MTLKRQLDGSEDHLPLKRIRRVFAHFPMSLFRSGPINVRDNTAPLGRQESCASCSQKIDSPNAKKCTFCERQPCGDCELVCFKCDQIYCGLCAIRTYAPLNNSGKCLSCG
ncbi:hypothetical protein TYRP_008081 [Tyrophagus putrescentiae]|nr:hypothetical protein TYRP_008081 [Tyrophagus putrescentiae]